MDLGQMSSFYIGLGTRINCNIFSYDYSGYGVSTGKPSEKNLYADIDAAWHALRSRYVRIWRLESMQLYWCNIELQVCFVFICEITSVLYQVWHQPWEYNPLWAEHWYRAHRGPGVPLWVCCRGTSLTPHLRDEGSIPWHQEDVLLWCLPKVSEHWKHFSFHDKDVNTGV